MSRLIDADVFGNRMYLTNGDFTHGKIDAWMDLPEPYKEDGE